MTIETKYQAGDLVWLISQDKVKTAIVRELTITEKLHPVDSKQLLEIVYQLESMGVGKYTESQLFHTKEELLNSL
jgi:hypothetical protein